MRPYVNFYSAVQDLHERGYTQDFGLFENYLYWAQEKSLITPSEYVIQEFHQFCIPAEQQNTDELVIFGIVMVSQDVKGILLVHDRNTQQLPVVILEKLFEMEYRNSLAMITFPG